MKLARSLPRISYMLGSAVLLVGRLPFTAGPVHAEEPPPSASTGGLPAPFSGFADEGVFHLFKDESRLGTMSCNCRPDGTFEGKSTLTMAGQTVERTLKIAAGDDGRWTTISMGTPLGPIEVIREGTSARVTFKEKTETVTLKPDTMLFENLSPVLMSQAIRAYDKAKGGKQTFPMFIVPQVVMEGSLEFTDKVERSIGGKDMTFLRYTYGVPGVDIHVWADEAGRLYFGDVPAQHARDQIRLG